MAYSDKGMSSSRITAIIIVAVIHAILGYAFVTGLAYNVLKKVTTDLKTFDVATPPPPDKKPPPPPPPQPNAPPPIVSPPAIVQTPSPPIQIRTSPIATPNPPITYTAPPAPPAPAAPPPPPPPTHTPKGAAPRGNPQSWVTDDDYPAAALRSGDHGTTGVRLAVGADGRVTDCEVTSSSGSSSLDSTACSLLRRRARFSPATDGTGAAVSGSWSSRFTWKLPAE
jgi:protein TonB